MEIEIAHELGVKVLEREESIVKASELYGELDVLVALALAADKYNWTAPQMTASNVIDIRGGRHPLQELVVPSFIQNDCSIQGGDGAGYPVSDPGRSSTTVADKNLDKPSMLILTGPNHSGKSVYLKQVALIVYLAHTGSFVPADHAVIGLTDRLLTRISTRESVSRNESAFSIDLRQVSFSMNFATPRSLIVVDEFGKGTNANNGASLLAALLDHFRGPGRQRPKVLVATHFHEILQHGIVEEGDDLRFAHMTVHVAPGARDPESQVTYLFQLAAGCSFSSFGTTCASLNGVEKVIVDRAEVISKLLAKGEDLKAACAKLSVAEEKSLEMAEEAARRFLELEIAQPRAGQEYVGGKGKGGNEISVDVLQEVLGARCGFNGSF